MTGLDTSLHQEPKELPETYTWCSNDIDLRGIDISDLPRALDTLQERIASMAKEQSYGTRENLDSIAHVVKLVSEGMNPDASFSIRQWKFFLDLACSSLGVNMPPNWKAMQLLTFVNTCHGGE